MKTKFYSFFAIFIIILFAWPWECEKEENNPVEPILTEPELIFSEDFESYNEFDTPWTISGVSPIILVSQAEANQGAQSLWVRAGAPINEGIYNESTCYKGDSKLYFSIYTQFPAKASKEITASVIEYNNIWIYIEYNYIYLMSTDSGSRLTFIPWQWNDCKLEIDWDTSKCKLIIDGVGSVQKSFTKPSASGGWGIDFSIHNAESGVEYYFDDLSIYKMQVDL